MLGAELTLGVPHGRMRRPTDRRSAACGNLAQRPWTPGTTRFYHAPEPAQHKHVRCNGLLCGSGVSFEISAGQLSDPGLFVARERPYLLREATGPHLCERVDHLAFDIRVGEVRGERRREITSVHETKSHDPGLTPPAELAMDGHFEDAIAKRGVLLPGSVLREGLANLFTGCPRGTLEIVPSWYPKT